MASAHDCYNPDWTLLVAGGGNPKSAMWVGQVSVCQDCNGLHVYYHADPAAGWCITETHLHIFTDADGFTDVPHNNGNPVPGHFAYSGEHPDCVAWVHYMIPDDAWGEGDIIYIAAHAVVFDGCEEETAWAGWTCDDGYTPEMEFPGENWATFFDYTIQ
jgi:hypothetical protein